MFLHMRCNVELARKRQPKRHSELFIASRNSSIYWGPSLPTGPVDASLAPIVKPSTLQICRVKVILLLT